ncbi:MAG: tRNA-dihydrouridine synthase family protein [Bradymonadales bacterium]|jgi:tRNA-dihydrouridine synthase 3
MPQAFLNCRVFLGSLTNVGNKPFRRLCKDYGAPATISEMVISHYAAKGGAQDLALMRKHESETIFGVQIEGSQINKILDTAKRAEEYGASFIDFNAACPHASVIKHGAGALLLTKPEKLRQILLALRETVKLPITLKMRKGYKKSDTNTIEIAKMAEEVGVSAVFLHARSKEVQYKGDNDWEIIEECAKSLAIPLIACGDLAHGPDVIERMQNSACAGFAIARGALQKPWIFKEIQEEKLLDPSAEERLEMLKTLVRYTLENFGDDARGRHNSRNFLHKQLAFLTRYVPVGAIGYPVPMQERPDSWTPRNELEELWSKQGEENYDKLLNLADFPSQNEAITQV